MAGIRFLGFCAKNDSEATLLIKWEEKGDWSVRSAMNTVRRNGDTPRVLGTVPAREQVRFS